MRIAFFSPLSPLKTAIADHAEGLLPYLAEHADIDVFIDDGYRPSDPLIRRRFQIFNYRQFPKRHEAKPYDSCIYHMGDEPNFHGYIYHTLLKHPGIVTLHDVVMHHFFLGIHLQQGDPDGYVAEMRYAYGDLGERLAQKVIAGQGEEIFHNYPLCERVLDAASGVIVHNEYAKRQVKMRRPGMKVTTIPQHFFLPAGFPDDFHSAEFRARLGLSDKFVVASYGFFIPDKRLKVALRAFARFVNTHQNAVYLLVGGHSPHYDLPGELQAMGLSDRVILTGWLEPVPFVQHMFVADLAIHLRYPHIGGTPYTPIRLMGLGRPTIVSDIEPLAEIPADCCARVTVDEFEEDLLLATMEYLADHPEVRHQMGQNARRYIREHHDPRRVAEAYIAFIEEVQAQPTPLPSPRTGARAYDQDLVREVAQVLAEWGVTEDDEALLHPVAKVLADLGLFQTACLESSRGIEKRNRD